MRTSLLLNDRAKVVPFSLLYEIVVDEEGFDSELRMGFHKL